MFFALIKTFLLAMVPVVELRGALPAGIIWGLTPGQAYLAAIVGNLVPLIALVYGLPFLERSLRQRIKKLDQFLGWWYGRVERSFGPGYRRFGALALVLFVAVPLPLTGGWSGMVAAHLFKIPAWRGLLLTALGVALAGLLVLTITLGTLDFFV